MENNRWIYPFVLAGLVLFWIPARQTLAENSYSVQTNTSTEFASKLKAAVIAARQYPKTEPAGIQGTTVVSFDYLNSVVDNIKVDKSSGCLLLDRAAKDAVKRAVYPSMPSELANIKLHVVVSVPFILK